MKKHLTTALCTLCTCLLITNAHAYEWRIGYLDLTNGYRQDRVTAQIESSIPTLSTSVDKLTMDNVSLYQLGLEGKWEWCNWFFKLEGDYGWSNNGDYRERVSDSEHHSVSKGDLHDGSTKDFDVGAGYLFPTSYCFAIGPAVGWSYHYQQFKTKNVFTDDSSDPLLNNLKYSNRWQGPWIGIDAVFHVCRIDFDLGYEYHWALWHGAWRLKGPDIPQFAFSDKRRSHRAYGQTAYLNGRWNFCACWNAGIGFTFQYWKATHGEVTSSGLLPNEESKVKDAVWCSYAIKFDVGYSF